MLSILLLLLNRFVAWPGLVPAFFITIGAVFYITVAAVPSLHITDLRQAGWIFDAPIAGTPWYHFYSYYSMLPLEAPYSNLLTFDRLRSC